MNKRLLIAFCLGILLLVFATGLFIWYAGRQLAAGTLLFGIPKEMLANPPIASEPEITARIDHIDPLSLLDNKPTGASNAATSYIEIVKSLSAREAGGALMRSSGGTVILTDDELEKFMEGVRQQECDFSTESLDLAGSSVRLAPVTDFTDNINHVMRLRQVGAGIITRGEEKEATGNSEAAIRYYEGVVKFGYDVEKRRESILQVLVGTAVQEMGAQKLKEFYESSGNTRQAMQWSDFLADLETFTLRFKDKTQKLTKNAGLRPQSVANALWILEHDEDELFRREAIAQLGVSRVFAGSTIDPILENIAASDPDPYVRQAAENALKLELPVRSDEKAD